MQVKAIERLTRLDHPNEPDILPGELVELDDWRAERLIALGVVATVTAKEADAIHKAAAKRAEDEAKAAQALADAAKHDNEGA